ncbi:hypothetical protein RN001_009258 [Aquatica leii]|uniref:LisH domain-containing protein n=1 Tax=Aquatica leii TaxID=1421715 RepID=A0AAN7SDR1_9COLE|nr:hypothetical protein RN001_009258 [Aquatica leii]
MAGVQTSVDTKCQQPNKISYHDIASKLINDRLLLTALELHTELVESGKELKLLRDYFSNPGNFEIHSQQDSPSLISRSGSQVTLDSLDLTRYSEDGERSVDERVAVLEFELRKARETISALRNNLTVAIESETSTPDKKTNRVSISDCIKPHEQRALNFLINEYLLSYGYKLTSITFADENESQDFEDWDDVGLNISKPAELLVLYREGLKQTGQNCVHAQAQTDFILKDEKAEFKIETLNNEIQKLSSKILELNTKVIDLQNENVRLCHENEDLASRKVELILDSHSKNSSSDDNSPEHFEIIDRGALPVKKQDAYDNVSNNSLNENEWTNLTITTPEIIEEAIDEKIDKIDNPRYKNSRRLPNNFKKELMSYSLMNKIDSQVFENITNETLIHMISQALLRIIPNVILNKREEVIPLLVCVVYLNPNASERDKLLQQLYNLKKKPSQEEREVILAGIISIARCSGENLVENEILPQCWEQLTHKYLERRLLVVESCIVLIPYVSSSIRNSLMLSMLQQMLEDREEAIREMVVRALAFIAAFCDDADKYWQCEELAMRTLQDTSDSVVNIGVRVLFPVLAQWALSLDRLQTDLIKLLLYKLNKHLKDEGSEFQAIHLVNVIDTLFPFILLYVCSYHKILDNIEKGMTIEIRPDILKLCTNLTNPSNFYDGDLSVGMILYEFDKFIADNPNTSWPQLDWLIDFVLPDLINNLNHVDVSHHSLLQSFIKLQQHICIFFGRNFTQTKIYSLYNTRIQNLEQILSSFNQYSPSLSIIPVYLISVLSFCDHNEITNVLKRFICALPLCGTPLDCLEISVKGLCSIGLQEIVVICLWDGVVHQRQLVRAAAAGLFGTIIKHCSEGLLASKVTPALVTLANDSDVLVRTATIPGLGNLITQCSVPEIHDKAYMQLQTCLSDPNCRENHTLLRQLVVTLGNIANNCKSLFRDDVILPQLSSLSTYTCQMSNQTRKVDMVLALLEAFSNIIYSPLSKQVLNSVLLPGLRSLETVVNENPSLLPHKESIISMIRETENRANYTGTQLSSTERASTTLGQNVNQGVEDMKQRVSKMFNKPSGIKQNPLPNLQGIFKKK